jgi:hypothetical protein
MSQQATNFYKHPNTKDGFSSTCKICHNEYNKKYRDEKSESIKQYQTQYRKTNTEKLKAYYKLYNQQNKENRKTYKAQLRKNNLLFKLSDNINTLIRMSIKRSGYSKTSKTVKILGCSIEDFKKHLEKQFAEGMTWDNRNKWHIDHKIPISWGASEEEIIALNHYTNLKPMWAEDNIKKSNKYIG